MNTAATLERPETSETDSALDRIIREKTHYWQQEGPAVNHLKNSGTRPRGAFAAVYRGMLAQIPAQARVLDVGCGHGRLAIPMAEAGYDVVATDVSRKMLDLLCEHKGALPIEVRLGDAHGLAAADGEFDAVVSSDFMPHFPDWPRLLKEKARVCRVGGVVVFAFNFTEHKTFAAPLGSVPFEHPYSPELNTKRPFWAECSVEEMIAAGEAAGLRLRQLVPIKFLHDSHAFGGALGTEAYREFQAALVARLDANPAVADFFTWLETTLFQRLPFFSAYSSLVVFERVDAATPAGQAPRPAVRAVDTTKMLEEIPSETSSAERRMLYDYFRNAWDGQGTVVEIGPFLGGTTRAIALGMSANALRSPEAKLHTFDRFDSYYSAEQLRRTIEPLVQSGAFTPAQADDLCRAADFERLFHAIHSPHDYANLVCLHNSPLPDRPEEIETANSLDVLAEQGEMGALFIDGCKSWAATHYAMKFLLPRTRVGAPVIFQDFGWYTCFWISAAAHALGDCLRFEARTDSTYAFRLTQRVTDHEVARRFGRRPADMGENFFRQAYAELQAASRTRGDLRGELIAQLHHVAALATLDKKTEAAAILKQLDVRRYAPHADMIRGCIKSPTYLPGGKQVLWR